jgi:hypothetical protein
MLIDPQGPVDLVLEQISSSETVVASSLHGLITADAYGIPCIWAAARYKFVGTGDFKYQDYQSSRAAGLNSPLAYEQIAALKPSDVSKLATTAGRPIAEWQNDLIKAFPF